MFVIDTVRLPSTTKPSDSVVVQTFTHDEAKIDRISTGLAVTALPYWMNPRHQSISSSDWRVGHSTQISLTLVFANQLTAGGHILLSLPAQLAPIAKKCSATVNAASWPCAHTSEREMRISVQASTEPSTTLTLDADSWTNPASTMPTDSVFVQ